MRAPEGMKATESIIAFRHDGGFARVRFPDVLYACTANERKIRLVTRKREYVRSNITLKNLLSEFGEGMFVQCHRSFAVNVTNIETIIPVTSKTWDIYFFDAPDEKCRLSINYRKAIEKLLGKR